MFCTAHYSSEWTSKIFESDFSNIDVYKFFSGTVIRGKGDCLGPLLPHLCVPPLSPVPLGPRPCRRALGVSGVGPQGVQHGGAVTGAAAAPWLTVADGISSFLVILDDAV